MQNKLITISIFIITLILNSIMMNRAVFAFPTIYDSVSPALGVNINDYAQIDNSCLGSFILINPGTGLNMKASNGRRYGNDTCTINFGYNYDDTGQRYSVNFGKTQPRELHCSSASCDCTGGATQDECIFSDINNPTDYTMDSLGNTDEEEFGFNISAVSLLYGSAQTDPDTSLAYNNGSAIFNIQDITTDPDTIIASSTSGACPYGSCSFDLTLHANMSVYEINDSGFTLFGTFAKFHNTGTGSPDNFTVRVTLTTLLP